MATKAKRSQLLTAARFKERATSKMQRVELADGHVYVRPPTPLQSARLSDAQRPDMTREERLQSELPYMAQLICDGNGERIFSDDDAHMIGDLDFQDYTAIQDTVVGMQLKAQDASKNLQSAAALMNTARSPTQSLSVQGANDGSSIPN